MKVSDVSKGDLECALGLLNVLKGAEIKVSPLDCHAVSVMATWLKNLHKQMADLHKAPPPPKPPEPLPLAAEEGMKIISYHPGDVANG